MLSSVACLNVMARAYHFESILSISQPILKQPTETEWNAHHRGPHLHAAGPRYLLRRFVSDPPSASLEEVSPPYARIAQSRSTSLDLSLFPAGTQIALLLPSGGETIPHVLLLQAPHVFFPVCGPHL